MNICKTGLSTAAATIALGILIGSVPSSAAIWTRTHNNELAGNYVRQLRSHARWSNFPVRIYFVRDANLTRQRAQSAAAAFHLWSVATGGYISYQFVGDPRRAQIRVRFSPHNDNGFTTTRYQGDRMLTALMTVGVHRGKLADVEAVTAHEFGHAMGLDGHSDSSGDLMFPYHYLGTPARITNRDLNTLFSLYPDIEQLQSVYATG